MSYATGSNGTDAWLTSAAVVATCALLFTVAPFWWLNARRGRLKSFEPHTFAMAVAHLTRLRLPLVLYNTGAVPIIAQNLRVRFLDQPDAAPLPWIAKQSGIMPKSGEESDLAAVFYVSGRSAHQIFAEFGADSLGFDLEKRDYRVRVEVKLGHKKRWKLLLDFTLHGAKVERPGNFITYSNRAEVSD